MPAFSKICSPNSNALVRSHNFTRDVFARTLCDDLILSYTPCVLDFVPVLAYGSTTYHMNRELANAIWFELIHRARVILCAANNFNPFSSDNTSRPLPTTIRLEALQQLGVSWPVVALTYIYPHRNPLLDEAPKETLFALFRTIQHAARWYSKWIFNAIQQSLALGPQSLWNWGAYYGYDWAEFFLNAGPGHPTANSLLSHSTSMTPFPVSPPSRDALVMHPTASSPARVQLVTDAHTVFSRDDVVDPTLSKTVALSGSEIVDAITRATTD